MIDINSLPIDHVALQPITANCLISASTRFNLPLNGLLSVLLAENGKPGSASVNKNGSLDLGPMQINTIWLEKQSPFFGYFNARTLANDVCTNIHAATWIIASILRSNYTANTNQINSINYNNIWTAIGKYHSPYNKSLAASYRQRVNSLLPLANQIIKNIKYYNRV